MSYKVTAAYVTLRVPDDRGTKVLREFYAGALIPDGADKGDLDRLCRKGLIAEEGTPQAAAAVPAGVPEPTAEQVAGRGASLAPAERPAGNASRDEWVAYASSRGAANEETLPVDEGGLTRDELRAKYGG